MKLLKTVCCIAVLLITANTYANAFRQTPDSLSLQEKPVYADVLKNAYSFLIFSPANEEYPLPILAFNTGWVYEGTDQFQKLRIFADDYLTEHYGKFIFEVGENHSKKAFLVKFFEGTVEPIKPQDNGYGPQDDEDRSWDEEIVIHYHLDNNQKVPFARFGTSEMCYISLKDQLGDWYFIFLHSGILCF